MAKKNEWLELVKKIYQQVLKEGKLKGFAAIREAQKRASKIYNK